MKKPIAILTLSTLSLVQAPAAGFDFKLPKIPSSVQEALAPVGGAILGGAGCAAFYTGKHKAMVTALCAAGGAWVGSALRDHLKEREKAQLAEATYTTLETGKGQTLRTEEGTQITTEIVKPVSASPSAQPNSKRRQSRDSSAQAPAASASSPTPAETTAAAMTGTGCNQVKQTIVTADNQRFEETVKACKEGDKWTVA